MIPLAEQTALYLSNIHATSPRFPWCAIRLICQMFPSIQVQAPVLTCVHRNSYCSENSVRFRVQYLHNDRWLCKAETDHVYIRLILPDEICLAFCEILEITSSPWKEVVWLRLWTMQILPILHNR